MANLAKVFKFSFAELCVLLEAWLVFFKWDMLISFTQYENWRSNIGDLSEINVLAKSITKNDATPSEQVKQIIKLSEIAGRFHIRKMNCLRRCLAQKNMLAKRGFNAHMHIGVSIKNNELKAHAWLTLYGKVINDSEDVLSRYSELKVADEHVVLNTLK